MASAPAAEQPPTQGEVSHELEELEAQHQARLHVIQQVLHDAKAVFDAEDSALHPKELALKKLFDAKCELEQAEEMLRQHHAEREAQSKKNDENMRLLRDELFRTQRALR